MARAKEEQRQPAGGATLVILAGLAMAFLLYVAFLSVVKSGSILSETNLLFAALVFYGGAGALYLGFGVTGAQVCVKFASLAIWLGLIVNSVAISIRWFNAGHPPLTSVYEMLLSFVWMLAVFTLIAEQRFGIKVIGAVTMPVAIAGMVLMQMLRAEVHPLVPLLQSNWLDIHVTLAIMAYATCALSFAFAVMFLVQDKLKTETFLAFASAATLAIFAGAVLTCVEMWSGMAWFIALAVLVVASPLACYGLARLTQNGKFLAIANPCVLLSVLLQAITLVLLVTRARHGGHPEPGTIGVLPFSLAQNPFILTGLVGGIFISLLFLLLVWRRPDLERLLPDASALDSITYRTISLAFPLLTLTIATGAYWANQTWGSYWNWDPKETWAAITWLVYALYLHMRITVGWRGRRAAYFAIVGFVVVIFTFFGVTYLLRGMHAFS